MGASSGGRPPGLWPQCGLGFFVALALALTFGFARGEQPTALKVVYNCRPDGPLDTKYFTPFYEGPRRVIEGCASSQLTPQGYQVHVIRLTQPTVTFVTLTAIGELQSRPEMDLSEF